MPSKTLFRHRKGHLERSLKELLSHLNHWDKLQEGQKKSSIFFSQKKTPKTLNRQRLILSILEQVSPLHGVVVRFYLIDKWEHMKETQKTSLLILFEKDTQDSQ